MFAQENNAESALEALKEMQSDHAKCMRGGKLVRVFGTQSSSRAAASGQPRPVRNSACLHM